MKVELKRKLKKNWRFSKDLQILAGYFFRSDKTQTHKGSLLSLRKVSLHKIPKFHLISWCGSFVERHSFCRVSGDSRET